MPKPEKAWLACAAIVFALCAWPLLLVDVPPYQDVANHLAVATIIDHPADYPEFVFNGFLKTNAALFAWEHFVGHVIGSLAAIRVFAALVLAVSALAFTRLVFVACGREKMIVATLFLAPMVHSFCVCLGLLDFSLGFAVAILLVSLLIEQRRDPTARRAILIALASIAAWFTHIIPLFLVHVLVLVELVITFVRSRGPPALRGDARALFVKTLLPMAPGTLLMTWSVLAQMLGPSATKLAGYESIWLSPWDLVGNLWVQWFLAFTPLSAMTIVPCVVLAIVAWRSRRDSIPFFSPAAFLVLAVLYAFVPYVFSFWAYANTRVAAFLWMAALVRVPSRLPKWITASLAACAFAYSISLGVDYVRLDHDRKEFVAGISSVPEHAALLPLIFETKGASVNTRPLSHAWGFYVDAKRTAAPAVFATSRMFGVAYREPPDPRLEHVALEHFVGLMRDTKWLCDTLETPSTCEDDWRSAWKEFWTHAEPRFDWLLVWDAPDITMTVIPPAYREVFRQGRLRILHRVTS